MNDGIAESFDKNPSLHDASGGAPGEIKDPELQSDTAVNAPEA